MTLSRLELLSRLTTAGVPLWSAHLGADRFGTVSREWVAETWRAAVESLQQNAPQLVDVLQLGGGKTILVPRYILNGFNCRGQHMYIYAHGLMGFALQAVAAAAPLQYDAIAWGLLEYTAEPRPDNRHRIGRHEQIWFVDHDGAFQTFEGGDGEEHEFTSSEMSSISYLYAQ